MPPLVTRSFYNSPSSLKVSNTLRQNFRHRTIITNCHWYKKSVYEDIGQRKSEKWRLLRFYSISHQRFLLDRAALMSRTIRSFTETRVESLVLYSPRIFEVFALGIPAMAWRLPRKLRRMRWKLAEMHWNRFIFASAMPLQEWGFMMISNSFSVRN